MVPEEEVAELEGVLHLARIGRYNALFKTHFHKEGLAGSEDLEDSLVISQESVQDFDCPR